MFESLTNLFTSSNITLVLTIVYYALFILVPAGLAIITWDLWVLYKQAQFFASQKYTILEVKLPKEIFKSPKAMEFFINGMYQTGGDGSFKEKYIKGQARPWFSLEMTSIDGVVRFFIWTRSAYKNQMEANLYSQYPGIEIYEVKDYTLPVRFDPEVNDIWGTEFDLTKPDSYPIKTYVDYGMDKDPKEEFKIDPLTPLIEFLGNVGRRQQVWIQIIVRAHKAEYKDPATGRMIDKRWAMGAGEEVQKILKKAAGEKDKEGKTVPGTNRSLTEGEKEAVVALERSVSKNGFDVGMRAVYIADKEVFNRGVAMGVVGGFTNFNSTNLNGFRGSRGASGPTGKQRILDAYKRRAYFYHPYLSPHFVLNTEELATIFHFPGIVSSTPNFTRIESRKAEAPANLPI